MKPPVVHQPVQPPMPDESTESREEGYGIEPSNNVAADDGYASTTGPTPGLVGDYGPIVETSLPEHDGAADDEREDR